MTPQRPQDRPPYDRLELRVDPEPVEEPRSGMILVWVLIAVIVWVVVWWLLS